jgi:hypothetical protein
MSRSSPTLKNGSQENSNMKFRNVLFGAALVVATAAITSQVVSQDHGGAPQMTPEQQAEMKKWEQFATPGPEHKLLQSKVGKWNGIMKHWMDPAAPPMQSKFTATISSLYEGRYIYEEVEGEGMAPGQTFQGQSWIGYDNLKKKYVWSWIDNMGTGLMIAEGTMDQASKTITYAVETPEPTLGKYVKGRWIEKWVSNDQMVSEMYSPDKTGKEIKMMELTFTRAK